MSKSMATRRPKFVVGAVWVRKLLRLSISAIMMASAISTLRRRMPVVSAWTTTTTRTNSRAALISSSSTSRSITRAYFAPIPAGTTTRTAVVVTPQSKFNVPNSSTRLFSSSSSSNSKADDENSLFVQDASFQSLGIQTPILLERLLQLGLTCPTKVQAGAFSKLTRPVAADDDDDVSSTPKPQNVIIGSETGSGKTLAYLLPLLDAILQQKQERLDGQRKSLTYDYARAIILVPNKELVQQVLRMALPLCGGPRSIVWSGGVAISLDTSSSSTPCPDHQVVRLAVLPGGLEDPMDFKPFRDTVALGGGTEPAIDLIVTTPAALGPLGLKPKHIDMFADIQTLVVDEADMLLDGGFIRPLENVLMGFRRADRLDPSLGVLPTQHVFCAATLPDMGLKSVNAYLQRKFPYAERIQMSGMHNARHYGLKQATQWIGPVETKKERMEQLISLLETPVEQGGLMGEKVMVFLNSVEDVEGAQGALERAGVASVPYHAKIGLEERSQNLDRFRRYDSQSSTNDKNAVSVLVCTDLASRGLDVPGVNAVVQLQFSGNVVSHLHRMGRCGRAGQRTGRGIVFYNEAEAELVRVVQEAEAQQERMVLEGDVDDQWGEEEDAGKVQKAFSRKRGFTKKRKKLQREA